ncbi:MAG: threonylcarbamoyl-AMP synthase [Clostridia bacterium]|nr:threonylcarbamoyl-AMP synthase [Clostridia bacterium]
MKDNSLNTKIIYHPSDEDIFMAAEVIRNGGLVAFPTETVYGLGASALSSKAAEKIFAAKGRPSDNPLIIHLADPGDATRYAITSPAYDKLSRFMPGPLTVILPKRDIIPSSVTGGLDTVAVRVPSHPIACALIRSAGVPIAAPSANRSGKPSCTTVEHVIQEMDGRVDVILDGGESDVGLESTILLPFGDHSVKLLRPGAITVEMLEAEGFTVILDKAVTERLADGEIPLAPGMKYRHYAPEAQVILLDGDHEAVLSYMQNRGDDCGVALIIYEEDAEKLCGKRLKVIGKRGDSLTYAHRLFAVLRELDADSDVKVIYAPLPAKDNLGLALYNRLMKAAGYSVKTV